MSDSATILQPDATEKSERIRRGSAPPALRLSDAVELGKRIYEQAAGSATYDTLSQITGNTKTSSTFVRKLSALRQYGIIQDTENVAALSEIGTRIAAPRDAGDDIAAIKEAMLRIDTLGKIFERHRGRLLPEDQFLRNILVQELKVPREVSDSWVVWFKDAANAAKLLFLRPDGKTQVLDGPAITPKADDPDTEVKTKKEVEEAGPAIGRPATVLTDFTAHQDLDRIVLLQLGRGRLAKLLLPEDWDSSKDLIRLLRLLKLSLSEDPLSEDEEK